MNGNADLRSARPFLGNALFDSKDELLFGGCLTTDWQMNDSERLALIALLHRFRPRVAIEIGTYRGGSLSAISQYVDQVFSIDTDPSIPSRLSHLPNARFLTGTSTELLPSLLEELRGSETPVDFVLIDADHTAAGVKRDVDSVIGDRPLARRLVVVHDSFNPECRTGILGAGWTNSDHVQWVDVDLVPGRIVEHGGGGSGELWGGLTCALMSPARRPTPLVVQQSARRMFERMAHEVSGGN